MSENSDGSYGWDNKMGIPLQEKLKTDLKTAMKSKDNTVRDAIRLIMGEYPKLTVNITLESGKKTTRVKRQEEITDEDLHTIIRSLVKSEKILLEAKKETESDYLKLLQFYLPKMAEKSDILAWINENIDMASLKNMNQAMGPIMKHFGKTADGKMVQEILKELS